MECEIWEYGRGFFKVYLEDRMIRDRIASWKECVVHGYYSWLANTNLGWDIIFPSKYFDRIAKLLGLPLKEKNPKRVQNAKQLGKKAVEDDHLGLRS